MTEWSSILYINPLGNIMKRHHNQVITWTFSTFATKSNVAISSDLFIKSVLPAVDL